MIEVARAGIYCRISSDRDETALGISRQEEDCLRLCADREWEVFRVYRDNNRSASSGKVRPAYEEMLDDIKAGLVTAVAVYDLDRLTRRPIELEEFVTVCDRAGVSQLAMVSGTVDMGTGDGLLVARIKGAVAAEEARKTAERIRRKHQQLAEDGLYSGGGSRPFGFDEDGITIREKEAELIRDAAERLLQGASLYSIRKLWEEAAVPTATGRPWSGTVIKAMLLRPRMVGLRQHRSTWTWDRKAVWPAILDRTTWEQLRRILTDPSRRQAPPSRRYPLRGILTCGTCGSYLTSMPRHGGRNYGCRKDSGGCGHVFISAEHAESQVFNLVLPFADSPDLLHLVEKEEDSARQRIRDLVAENLTDQAMIRQLTDDYADRLLTRDRLKRQTERLNHRVSQREDELSRLQGRSALGRVGGRVEENWDNFSADDQRAILRSLISKATVAPSVHRGSNIYDRNRLSISLRYDAIRDSAAEIVDSDGVRYFIPGARVKPGQVIPSTTDTLKYYGV
jgi:site-specific DNA recombinase